MADSRICSIDDCGKPTLARGFCRAHYLRWWKYGSPKAGGPEHGRGLRFYEEVVKHYDGNDCLFWPYGRNTYGYPMVVAGGVQRYVHRMACEEEHGPPPAPNLDAAHSCGNGHKACVTRKHLRWATRAENLAEMIEHGTSMRGEKAHFAKLTEPEVLAVRSLARSVPQKDLAVQFNVSQPTISNIVLRRSWSWLD